VINLLKGIFGPNPKAKNNIPFQDKDLADSIAKNRESLLEIDNWIDEESFKKSCFQYGVPDFIKSEINKKISNQPTYTDLILALSGKYFKKLNYLEIGVSVGKNFFQLLNAHTGADFTGFDIEEINPVLERKLELTGTNQWSTPADSIKKSPSSLKTYRFRENAINYLCADVWDQNSWSKLEGDKFNLIFSDALHSPEAILFEFEMLAKYGLLDEKFIIVWDDLVGKMKNSFYKIIRKYNEVYRIKEIYLLQINGWVGEHEKAHSVGIISSFNF
jgi:hypothetical protein